MLFCIAEVTQKLGKNQVISSISQLESQADAESDGIIVKRSQNSLALPPETDDLSALLAPQFSKFTDFEKSGSACDKQE